MFAHYLPAAFPFLHGPFITSSPAILPPPPSLPFPLAGVNVTAAVCVHLVDMQPHPPHLAAASCLEAVGGDAWKQNENGRGEAARRESDVGWLECALWLGGARERERGGFGRSTWRSRVRS